MSQKIIEKVIEFLKKSSDISKKILWFAVLFLVLYLIIWIFQGNLKEFKDSNKSVKKIEKKVDSLWSENDFRNERLYEIELSQIRLEEELKKNNILVSENNKKINELKRIYNEKIRSVDHFTIDDIDSFFAKRYPDKYFK